MQIASLQQLRLESLTELTGPSPAYCISGMASVITILQISKVPSYTYTMYGTPLNYVYVCMAITMPVNINTPVSSYVYIDEWLNEKLLLWHMHTHGHVSQIYNKAITN